MNIGLLAKLISQSEQFMRKKVSACKDREDNNADNDDLLKQLDVTGEVVRYNLVCVGILGVLVGDVDKFAKMPEHLKEGAREKSREIISTMALISDEIDSLEGIVELEKVNKSSLIVSENIEKLKVQCKVLSKVFVYGKNKADDIDCSF